MKAIQFVYREFIYFFLVGGLSGEKKLFLFMIKLIVINTNFNSVGVLFINLKEMIILKLSKYIIAGICGLSIAAAQTNIAHADAVGTQNAETVSVPPVCLPVTGSKLVKRGNL